MAAPLWRVTPGLGLSLTSAQRTWADTRGIVTERTPWPDSPKMCDNPFTSLISHGPTTYDRHVSDSAFIFVWNFVWWKMFITHKVQSIALPCRIECYLRGVGRRYTADSSIELVTIIISIFISKEKPPFFFWERERAAMMVVAVVIVHLGLAPEIVHWAPNVKRNAALEPKKINSLKRHRRHLLWLEHFRGRFIFSEGK